jgi:uroporphyrinogen decarboxylase
MNSKERVKKAVKCLGPDRLPFRYVFSPEKSDVLHAGIVNPEGWNPPSENVDEWGCEWDTLNNTILSSFGQVKGHPLKSLVNYEEYKFPDPLAAGRFRAIIDTILKYPDKYIIAGIGLSGFNRMTFIRGMEEFLLDLYAERNKVMNFIDDVFTWESEVISQIIKMDKVDAVAFADDWGTQNALMISPGLWKSLFKPWYEKQFGLVRSAGKDVLFHSCGKINDIISDLIGMGANILNLNQPKLIGIDWLADSFGGKACFMCPVDMQTTMISGSSKDIRLEAKYLVKRLGAFSGGFIPCMDEGVDHGYVAKENICAMEKAFRNAIIHA